MICFSDTRELFAYRENLEASSQLFMFESQHAMLPMKLVRALCHRAPIIWRSPLRMIFSLLILPGYLLFQGNVIGHKLVSRSSMLRTASQYKIKTFQQTPGDEAKLYFHLTYFLVSLIFSFSFLTHSFLTTYRHSLTQNA